MKQTNKLFQKKFSLKFPLSAIERKTIVLLTGFILLLTCTITGCGSNSRQQSTLPVTEPIPVENPVQEESAQPAKASAKEGCLPSFARPFCVPLAHPPPFLLYYNQLWKQQERGAVSWKTKRKSSRLWRRVIGRSFWR